MSDTLKASASIDGVPLAELEPDQRCAKCRRLLFRGKMIGEIKCRCGYLMRFKDRAVKAPAAQSMHATNSP